MCVVWLSLESIPNGLDRGIQIVIIDTQKGGFIPKSLLTKLL